MRLFTYYLLIILPIPSLYWAATSTTSMIFCLALLFYVLLYRPLVDGFRLINLGLLAKSKHWKMFIASPYYQLKYFRELYFVND